MAFTPVILFFKEKPEHPPSYASESQRKPYFEALKDLWMNYDFRYLCLAFSISLGNFVLFLNIIHSLVSPYGFTNSEIGYIGAIMNLSSFFGKLSTGT